MAIQDRTKNIIQMRLRPSSAAEFIAACNSLNAPLSKDTRLQLQARMARPVVLMLADLVALPSKGTLLSSAGSDALLLKGLAQWLGDIPASQDIVTTIATVT
jgi:hypothetical protein